MIDQCYHPPIDVLEAYCRITGIAAHEICGPTRTRPSHSAATRRCICCAT